MGKYLDIVKVPEVSTDKNAHECDLVYWSQLTPEQREALLTTVKAGHSARIYSGALGEAIWWVKDQATAEDLKRQGHSEVCYTLDEPSVLSAIGYNYREAATHLVEKTGGVPLAKDFITNLHALKKAFGGILTLAPEVPSQVIPVTTTPVVEGRCHQCRYNTSGALCRAGQPREYFLKRADCPRFKM